MQDIADAVGGLRAVHDGVEAAPVLFVAAPEEQAPFPVSHGVEGLAGLRILHAARREALVRDLEHPVETVAEGIAPVGALIVHVVPVGPAGIALTHRRREGIPAAGRHGEMMRRIPSVFLPGVFIEIQRIQCASMVILPGDGSGARPRASRPSHSGILP